MSMALTSEQAMADDGTRIHEDEVDVDDDTIRALVDMQFPEHRNLPLSRWPVHGTDNVIYRLGEQLGLRVPRIHWAVGQSEKEITYLPRLAPHLPTAVPQPIALGEPGLGYPYPWLLFRWVPGTDALTAEPSDWTAVARQLAQAISALQAVPVRTPPPPAARAGPLRTAMTAELHQRIGELEGLIDPAHCRAVLQDGVDAGEYQGPPVWVHGDLSPGNVLVDGDALSGVVDWASLSAGDPSIDLVIAWDMPPAARAAYRSALDIDVDDATWVRARAWAVQQTVLYIPYYRDTIPAGVRGATRRLLNALNNQGPPASGAGPR